MPSKLPALLALLCVASLPSYATNTSTADPTYPEAYEDIDSTPLRNQFDSLINDIDNLWAAIGPNFLEANQLIGALVSGKAAALPVPSCFSPTNALIWRPGLGFGCNDIAAGGGGSLGPAPAFTVIAGPAGGSPAVPTAIQLTGNYLPLPTLNSIGGVQSGSAAAHQFMNGISTSGVPLFATPAFTDISGALIPTQLPAPTPSSIGGTESIAVVAHNFMTGISTSGVPTQAQPSFNDTSGNISVGQMASGVGASSTTYWRGDGTWASIGAGGLSNPVTIGQGGSGQTTSSAALDAFFSATTTQANPTNYVRDYGPTSASAYYPQNRYVFNDDPILIPHISKCIAKVQANQGNCRIPLVGDSTQFGVGSNGTDSGNLTAASPAADLAAIFNAHGINASYNAWWGNQGGFQTLANDARVTVGSSWSNNTHGYLSLGGEVLTATTNTDPIAFTPTTPIDSCKVWYGAYSGGGTISLDINGSGTTSQSTNGTGMGSVTVTATRGINTCDVKWVSGSNVYVLGMEAWDSSKSTVIFENAGWSGSTAALGGWNATGEPTGWSPSQALTNGSFDGVVINLGINDWDGSLSTGETPAQFKTAVQTLITGAQAGNADVVLETPTPTNPSGNASVSTQISFMAQLYGLAQTDNLPLVDFYDLFQSYAVSQPLGLYSDTFTHPNQIGYEKQSGLIAGLLLEGASKSSGGQNPVPFGSNLSGQPLDFFSGVSTGTGTSGISFWVYPAGTSGSSQNNPSKAASVNPDGGLSLSGNYLTIGTLNTPADNAACTAGTIWVDTGFIYVCAVSGTVKRAALSSF